MEPVTLPFSSTIFREFHEMTRFSPFLHRIAVHMKAVMQLFFKLAPFMFGHDVGQFHVTQSPSIFIIAAPGLRQQLFIFSNTKPVLSYCIFGIGVSCFFNNFSNCSFVSGLPKAAYWRRGSAGFLIGIHFPSLKF